MGKDKERLLIKEDSYKARLLTMAKTESIR